MAGSSSYPLSTTACRRARVTESRLANKVTSQPRATSPSVMLLATVSQAPYCRGGIRQAIGERIATLFWGTVMRFDTGSLRRIVHYLHSSHQEGDGIRIQNSGVAEWAADPPSASNKFAC